MTLAIWRVFCSLISLLVIILNLLKSRLFCIFGRSFHQEHAAKISDNFRTTKFFNDNFRIMCKILSRIKTLADAEGISIGTIERTIGASRGVISKAIAKGTDIQSKWLELICEKFPKYSPVWLLTGQGAMLLESSDTPIIHSSVPEDHIDEKIFVDNPQKLSQNPVPSMVNTFLETIKQQAEEIGRLKARIEELERDRSLPMPVLHRRRL